MRNTFIQTAFQMSRVDYSTFSDSSSAVQMSTVLASITTFDTPTDLMKGTIYYFRVYVMNSAGFGPVSDTMSARTNVNGKYTSSLTTTVSSIITISLTCNYNNNIKFVQYLQLHKECPIFGIKIHCEYVWCVRMSVVAVSAQQQ